MANNPQPHSTNKGETEDRIPEWALNVARRIAVLAPGRYLCVLTVANEHDLTVTHLGKTERLG
jgi:hypothetical protein